MSESHLGNTTNIVENPVAVRQTLASKLVATGDSPLVVTVMAMAALSAAGAVAMGVRRRRGRR